jgi:molybdopterin-guanine dinucleotide biosynthesis adapter protein
VKKKKQRIKSTPQLVSFVGRSNSGKTTLLIQLIPIFVQQGLKVGTVKNTHHKVDFDDKGKDSWKHAQAGSSRVMVTSGKKMAVFSNASEIQPLSQMVQEWFQGYDLVLSEGFKNEDSFKIEVCREANQKPPLYLESDYKIDGVIGDMPPEIDLPYFSFEAQDDIVKWVMSTLQLESPSQIR